MTRSLASTQRAFLDRVLRTGGADPGRGALDVPDERVAVYRDMVLGGYQMMVSFVYTESVALLERVLAEEPAADGATNRTDVVARFVATAPAGTHSTREIADRFLAFFGDAYPDVVARRPELPDLLRVERAELRAHYHADDDGHGADAGDTDRIRALTVDEFLALRVLRAPSASLLRLAYPVSALQRAIRRGEFPPSPSPEGETVSVARHPVTLLPVVRALPPAGATLLSLTLPPGADVERPTPFALDSLAERWLADGGPADGDETAAFRLFGDVVLDALADGFLRLA